MFKLPELPYKYDALEPFIDAKTMEIHHTKHHQTYIYKLNAIIESKPELKDKTLEELVKLPETKNMAGGHSNHSFFWEIMAPKQEDTDRGWFDEYKKEFTEKASTLFGSGWVWFVKNKDKFEVVQTPLQDSPLIDGMDPVLGIDVWEHAYYLQYKWNRAEYINNWFNVVNWKKVTENFNKLKG